MDKERLHLLRQGTAKGSKAACTKQVTGPSKRFSPHLWVVSTTAAEPIVKGGQLYWEQFRQ